MTRSKRRLYSLLLALCLTAGLIVPAYASEDGVPAPEASYDELAPPGEEPAQESGEAEAGEEAAELPEEIAGETIRRYFSPDTNDLPGDYAAAPEDTSLPSCAQRELRRLAEEAEAVRAAFCEGCSFHFAYDEPILSVLARAAAVTAVLSGWNGIGRSRNLTGGELALFESVCRAAVTLTPVIGETVFVPSEGDAPAEGTGSDKVLQITVYGTSLEELCAAFGADTAAAEALLDEAEYSLCVQSLTEYVPAGLPETLSPLRRTVVGKACSLAGKVPYSWGGKSSALGWDTAWGTPVLIRSEGSESSGTIRQRGLDCSGFVSWAFINAAGTAEAAETLGSGTFGLWNHSVPVEWSEVQPGDLLWYGDITTSSAHVGLAVGTNEDGELLVCHASGGAENIVIETAEEAGFCFASRPAEFYARYGASPAS